MLWNPQAIKTEGRSESGGLVDKLRTWAQPAYSIPLFLLALVGAVPAAARLALRSSLALLAYQTLVAMGFAGATRYRVPWDFLLALAAARGDLVRSSDRGRTRGRERSSTSTGSAGSAAPSGIC